jgi:hypothetical protein
MIICSVLCLSSSATVRRSTPAITSLLAKVCRLQCQVYPQSRPLQARWETSCMIRVEFPCCEQTEKPGLSLQSFEHHTDAKATALRDYARTAVLSLGKMCLPALEIYLFPAQAILFSRYADSTRTKSSKSMLRPGKALPECPTMNFSFYYLLSQTTRP